MASTEASSSSEPKFLTGEQIAEANENGKLYIVVHGKVVDLSSYRNDHPGGEEVLLDQAGQDATEAFEDIGHSSDARDIMNKNVIADAKLENGNSSNGNSGNSAPKEAPRKETANSGESSAAVYGSRVLGFLAIIGGVIGYMYLTSE